MSVGWKWFIELQTPYSAHMHGIIRTIYSDESEYQKIDIVETCEYGKALLLDGKFQSSVRDEYYYHEPLVHPALISHPSPRDVLIVGGGEGGTLREVLRHGSVRRAVMIDIDRKVVDACRRHLPEISAGAFDDPRAELVIGDGRRYVEGREGDFDAIIMDVTDPMEKGPGNLLYTREFYEAARKALREGGILVTQATSTYYSRHCFSTVYRTVSKAFGGKAGGYHAWVPVYDSLWGFVYGTKLPDPGAMDAAGVDREIARRGITGLRLYSGAIHASLFALPDEVTEAMRADGKIATDAEPTFMPI